MGPCGTNLSFDLQSLKQRTAATAVEGLALAYAADESDEFVKATRIGDAVKVQDGDSIVFMNFRADRAREITKAFVEKILQALRVKSYQTYLSL